MRIISPVDKLAEAEGLLDAGADELYGGYLPPAWERYGLAASLNQRTFAGAQLATEEELAGVVALVHARGKRFALTLNAPFYTDAQMPLILDYVERMVELGVDILILADPGLLRTLKRRRLPLELHASTLAHLSNAGAVRFMAAQGFDSVVLPRHLSVADMVAIVREVPGIGCDAFLLVGKCPNSEGLCTFHHSSPAKVWPCEIPYEIAPLSASPSIRLERAMQRQGSWAQSNRRHGCGLCAIPHLLQAGMSGLKLVGRGAPAEQKIRNVAMTREFLDLAGTCADFGEYRRRAVSAHRERFGAECSRNVCYYPEFFNGGES